MNYKYKLHTQKSFRFYSIYTMVMHCEMHGEVSEFHVMFFIAW